MRPGVMRQEEQLDEPEACLGDLHTGFFLRSIL